MSHSLSIGSNNGSSDHREGDGDGSYWETPIVLALLELGTLLRSLVIPLLVAIAVQFAVQFLGRTKREAAGEIRRHAESLERDRQRLIEEIKIDLLKTLHKGGTVAAAAAASSGGVTATNTTTTTTTSAECQQKIGNKARDVQSTATSPSSSPVRKGTDATAIPNNGREASISKTAGSGNKPTTRRLDRKECSNIVNEIIYQIQSGSKRNVAEATADGGGQHRANGGVGKTESRAGGNAEDSAILRDVHKRNVVARMKTLFEQQPARDLRFLPSGPEKRRPHPATSLRHFSSVVNILRRSDSTGSASRSISASLENLPRPATSGNGVNGGQFLKATSEPPTMIRLRRRIRSQQSLSESVEDILESERFSKRLSQYSISDLLDEDDNGDQRTSEARFYGDPKRPASPYDRVSRGLKTLSTFSLSELLQDEDESTVPDGAEEVVLRRSHPSGQQQPPAAYRNAVDNIEQILIAENLSKDYWKYSISNLLDDCMGDGDGDGDGDGGFVRLRQYS